MVASIFDWNFDLTQRGNLACRRTPNAWMDVRLDQEILNPHDVSGVKLACHRLDLGDIDLTTWASKGCRAHQTLDARSYSAAKAKSFRGRHERNSVAVRSRRGTFKTSSWMVHPAVTQL
jgi:hypothetical protein